MDRQHLVRIALQYVLLTWIALVFIFPIIFMIVSSLKPDLQLLRDSASLRAFLPVGDLSLDNYFSAFDRAPIARFIFNSVFITAATLVLSLLLCSLAGFSFVFLNWRGRAIILSIILATFIIPFETIAIPLLLIVNNLPWVGFDGFRIGWLNSYQVQIIPWIADALTIFLFVQYFKDLPRDLVEAARVDGATWLQVYRRVIMPLSGPVLATGCDPQIPHDVQQPVHLADHGGSRRILSPDHGGLDVLLSTQHRMGRDHGVSHHHHSAGSCVLPCPAEGIHRLDRKHRNQGIVRWAKWSSSR